MEIITIRASSLSTLFDCPARFEAVHLLGKRLPSSGAARLGTAIHASTAVYDQSRLDGNPVTADESAGALVDAIYSTEEEVQWEDANPRDAERIGLALHARYCSDIAPKQNYVGVELKCERLEITDLGLALTGTTDRIRRLPDGRLGVADLKSGARAVGSDGRAVVQGHGPQIGVYELLGEHSIGELINGPAQIIGLQTGKTPAAQKVGTGEILSARAALIGDAQSPGLLEHASRIIHSGLFYGNPKSVLCSARYCPNYATCKFKG